MVDYVQDLFYVFLIAVAVAVPLIAYYIFKHLTTLGGACHCIRDKKKKKCTCTVNKGYPKNTDCSVNKIICEGLGDLGDAWEDVSKAVAAFLSQPWWACLLEIALGLPFMLALFAALKVGLTKGLGNLKGKVEELMSGDRRVRNTFKDIKEDLIDARKKLETENKDLEAKKAAETDPAEKKKLQAQIDNNKAVLEELRVNTNNLQEMQDTVENMMAAKSIKDAQRQSLREIGSKAEQIQRSIMDWQDALQSAAGDISAGTDGDAGNAALDKVKEMADQIEAQKEQFDKMVNDFHPEH